jgi:hypothetical protein
MKIFSNIITFLLVILVTGFFTVSSFTFSEAAISLRHANTFTIARSTARVIKTELGTSSIEKIAYSKKSPLTLEK